MPSERLSMRNIRELLRLTHGVGLSNAPHCNLRRRPRESAACADARPTSHDADHAFGSQLRQHLSRRALDHMQRLWGRRGYIATF